MRALLAVVVTVVLVGLVARPGHSAPAPAPYIVIVNAGSSTASVSRKFLGDAFLKKVTRWDGGEMIRPVDQAPDTEARRKFSEDVLKRSVAAVRSYWQQAVFSGRDVPPPELNTDQEVVKYVAKFAGAVGYVTSSVNLEGVKVVAVY